ncbi:hypothetical protein BVRB_6g151260 [Beta vulgaris subsp. vulgaris]|nr:hypothetical protein BVRB_6g151260 [Beta vulgaris subsp. vulgaris]
MPTDNFEHVEPQVHDDQMHFSDGEEPEDDGVHIEPENEVTPAPVRRSERQRRIPSKYDDYILQIPEKAPVEAAANMIVASLNSKQYYDKEYIVSLNNVFKGKKSGGPDEI